jgi:hypothetical protein
VSWSMMTIIVVVAMRMSSQKVVLFETGPPDQVRNRQVTHLRRGILGMSFGLLTRNHFTSTNTRAIPKLSCTLRRWEDDFST